MTVLLSVSYRDSDNWTITTTISCLCYFKDYRDDLNQGTKVVKISRR